MINVVEKLLISSSHNSHWKHRKNSYLKLYLPDWYIFLCTFATIFEICRYITYLQFTNIKSVKNNILNPTASIKFCTNSYGYQKGLDGVRTHKIGMSQTHIYSFGISTHWILYRSFIKHQSTTLKAQTNQIYQRKNLFSFLPMTNCWILFLLLDWN